MLIMTAGLQMPLCLTNKRGWNPGAGGNKIQHVGQKRNHRWCSLANDKDFESAFGCFWKLFHKCFGSADFVPRCLMEISIISDSSSCENQHPLVGLRAVIPPSPSLLSELHFVTGGGAAINEGHKLRRLRNRLPIHSYRNTILQTIWRNSATVVVADTGAGKTTQVPPRGHLFQTKHVTKSALVKFCTESYYKALKNEYSNTLKEVRTPY